MTKCQILFFLFISCAGRTPTVEMETAENELRQLTRQLTDAEIADDLETFLEHYNPDAVSMPEYQLTLEGQDEIGNFYREIFARQKIRSFERVPREYIHLDSMIVEIGTFKKEYSDSTNDSVQILRGKYWYVWKRKSDTGYKISGESFGFFHHVPHPERMVVLGSKTQPDESRLQPKKEIPFELKAYNALMEKGVRTRDGVLRSGFFTGDGSFNPFADTTVTGMAEIKPYLIAYSSRGTVRIDSIMCYTYDFEQEGDLILEYDMFKVKWSVPDFSGRTEGKGIRIWKRQADHSLRLFREIGTHNHLE